MPYHLCFTDLIAKRNNPNCLDNDNGVKNEGKNPAATAAADASSSPEIVGTATLPTATETGASNQRQHQHTTMFVREENKKSSFLLQRPCALSSYNDASDQKQKLAQAPVGGDDNADENENDDPVNDDEQRSCGNGSSEGATVNTSVNDEKHTMIATACITSCVSTDANVSGTPQLITSEAQETFLFGGFELITNVKTVEVYVVRSSSINASSAPKTGKESYLTTCKGIPVRDLPPLTESPPYIDGTRSANEEANAKTEAEDLKETSNSSSENDNNVNTKEMDIFYKFIFVSPGGPKPMERVRLKLARNNATCTGQCIIVRVLKVKGRLSDSMPSSKAPQQQSMQQPSMPFGGANFNPGMLNGQGKDNMGGLASMMAMMGGGNGAMGMPMAPQMTPQQQQIRQMQMQTQMQMQMQPSNQQYVQQQNNHQQEKNQAEIMSSVAGLGLFLKSSEERTMKRIETMMSEMEGRVMERLDGIAGRLNAIEQSITETSGDLDST